MSRITAVILSALCATVVFAEIHPKYYREMQEKASEQLRIKTTSVSRDWYFWRSERTVKVEAEVTGVVKSAAGLREGSKIYFEYVVFTPSGDGWAGPRPMPLLKEGTSYDFFGEKAAEAKGIAIILTPTARGYSFEALPQNP